jgi:hypothetical protein
VSAWAALGGFGVSLAMLAFVEAVDRFDLWMRDNGLGRVMIGSREYATIMKCVFRVLISAFGLFCLVLFFDRL